MASKAPQLSAKDKQYLYEQWALFRLLQVSEDEEEQNDNQKDVNDMVKESVKWAAKTNSRSNIAYFELKNRLESEIEVREDPDAKRVLVSELAYLDELVGQYDKAFAYLDTWLKNDPNDIEFLWKVVDIDVKQERYGKAHELLEKTLKHQYDLSPHQKELAIEVTTRALDMNTSSSELIQLFSHLYLQSAQPDAESQTSSICTVGIPEEDVQCEGQTKADVRYNIFIIGLDRYNEVIQFAEHSLKQANFEVFTPTTSDNLSDVMCGEVSTISVKDSLERSMVVLIHPEQIDKNPIEEDKLYWVVEEGIDTHPSHCCYLING